ncbi:MAG: sulfur oxidation c-type cytochrome SoxA, partial [Gammaproteobacteria bacterium]
MASPQGDLEAFRSHFTKRFPAVPFQDFSNGVYSVDSASREQWESIEEFPPYELNIEKGEAFFNKSFANGKGYADCFNNGGIGVKQEYPFFDTASGQVITLEMAINACRESNGEKALKWKKGELADISAYMSYTSRGNKVNVVIPDDAKAMAA